MNTTFTYYNGDISDLIHDYLADRKEIWGDIHHIDEEFEILEREGWIWLITKKELIAGQTLFKVTLGREFLN